ncbi:MAG: CapA family protein [Clostridia bacterium]|nr:CapA family protein [Clostridia bacterium]
MSVNRVLALSAAVLLILSAAFSLSAFNGAFCSTDADGFDPSERSAGNFDLPVPSAAEKPDDLDELSFSVDIININADKLPETLAAVSGDVFWRSFADRFGEDKLSSVASAAEETKGRLTDDDFIALTGYSPKAAVKLLSGDISDVTVIEDCGEEAEIVFVGDTAFVDGWSLMRRYNSRKKGVDGIVSSEILDIMRSADITMANNEFVMSERGTPIPGKRYTLRGKPEYVSILLDMGIDIVGMANNHAFDYGEDALTDTIATLESAGIRHVGAGEDLSGATAPYYYVIGGRLVSFVASSTVDVRYTRAATVSQSGVFRDDGLSLSPVITAREKEIADIVIVFMHWGTESTTVLSDTQKILGKALVDAGADLVIGMHSHCMQGVEYYKGKMIAYSLGNFTFSNFKLTAGLVKTVIGNDGTLTNKYFTLIHENNYTVINSGSEGKNQLERLRRISVNAVIDDDFTVRPK